MGYFSNRSRQSARFYPESSRFYFLDVTGGLDFNIELNGITYALARRIS